MSKALKFASVEVALELEQLEELQVEAARRKRERGGRGRASISEVVREAVEGWRRRRPRAAAGAAR